MNVDVDASHLIDGDVPGTVLLELVDDSEVVVGVLPDVDAAGVVVVQGHDGRQGHKLGPVLHPHTGDYALQEGEGSVE